MGNISIDQLGEAIKKELTLYSSDIVEGVKRETKKNMAKLVKKTKDTAPVGHRDNHYRDSISSRKSNETEQAVEYQWYVKAPDYRLSHLLENGHAKRDGGRTKGTGFISKAEENILEEYEKAVEEVCKNGG